MIRSASRFQQANRLQEKLPANRRLKITSISSFFLIQKAIQIHYTRVERKHLSCARKQGSSEFNRTRTTTYTCMCSITLSRIPVQIAVQSWATVKTGWWAVSNFCWRGRIIVKHNHSKHHLGKMKGLPLLLVRGHLFFLTIPIISFRYDRRSNVRHHGCPYNRPARSRHRLQLLHVLLAHTGSYEAAEETASRPSCGVNSAEE